MAHIAAVTDITTAIGISRSIRGFAITCPVGNPKVSPEEEHKVRKKYVERAIELLQEESQPGVPVDVR